MLCASWCLSRFHCLFFLQCCILHNLDSWFCLTVWWLLSCNLTGSSKPQSSIWRIEKFTACILRNFVCDNHWSNSSYCKLSLSRCNYCCAAAIEVVESRSLSKKTKEQSTLMKYSLELKLKRSILSHDHGAFCTSHVCSGSFGSNSLHRSWILKNKLSNPGYHSWPKISQAHLKHAWMPMWLKWVFETLSSWSCQSNATFATWSQFFHPLSSQLDAANMLLLQLAPDLFGFWLSSQNCLIEGFWFMQLGVGLDIAYDTKFQFLEWTDKTTLEEVHFRHHARTNILTHPHLSQLQHLFGHVKPGTIYQHVCAEDLLRYIYQD